MQVRKAVITAAGRGVHQYPASDTAQKAMLPVVDRDGLTKPVIQIIAEEALESGIEEICVVTAPGDDAIYRQYFQAFDENLLQAYGGAAWSVEQSRRLAELERRFRFAMEPVVYHFRINDQGSMAELRQGSDAVMPPRYYAVQVPALSRIPL